MTGFARAAGQAGYAVATWEVKSVNGKSAEVRLRLPPGYDRLEPAVRQALQQRFSRGNFQAALTIARTTAGTAQPVVNEEFLKDVAQLAKRLETQFGVAPPTADGLLALRGVLEIPESIETDQDRNRVDGDLMVVLDHAIGSLETARRSEGTALGILLSTHLDEIETLTNRASSDPSREPSAIRARLAEQVGMLMGSVSTLDEQRLYAEAALLATKADIREEIDRLTTHIASARSLLSTGGPIGRKLDFLAQEFNRESNTLCSKSNAAAITAIGLELKAAVDRFREQVQNLE